MRVLVTGHRGYLGTVLVPELLRSGHQVAGLDAGLFDACRFTTGGEMAMGVPAVVKDVRDVDVADLEGFDAVIHLAGLSNDPLGEMDPGVTHAINHRASVRLAEAAKQAGVGTLMLASSCSVYGASTGEELTEASPLAPVTAYATAKLAMERDIAGLADAGFHPVFLRSGTVYGLSPMIRFDLVVNNLVAWAGATGKVHLKSDGMAWRPLVHVADIARTFVALMERAPDLGGQAVNVVDDRQNMLVRDLAGRIAARLTEGRISMAEAASTDTRNYRVSGRKLAGILGDDWFRFGLDDAISGMAEAFHAAGLGIEDFEGPRFQRLAHLRQAIETGRIGPDLRLR